jgi:tungstate transport system ATP-binding protein
VTDSREHAAAPEHAAGAPSPPHVVRVHDLVVKRTDQEICRVAEMTVSQGERIAITGRNGCGKTTLLRVLAGLEPSFTGSVDIAVEPAECVFVHQSPFLFRGTVLHNVTYGLAARSVPRTQRRNKGLEWLSCLDMVDFADRNVRGLSGGERRRVALARAGILEPKLLLLDEPLSDLDQSGIECVHKSLARLQNSTILLASPTPLPEGFVDRTIQFD